MKHFNSTPPSPLGATPTGSRESSGIAASGESPQSNCTQEWQVEGLPGELPAVELRGVTVRYRSYLERHSSLKEAALKLMKGKSPESFEYFDALSNLSLVIPRGAVLGVLGSNGSGKSTLLKVLAGVLKPSEGEVLVRGSIASLIELGVAFDPELNAIENLYLHGALHKKSRAEIKARIDHILDFAELSEMATKPIKYYSSGMIARLGFSASVDVDPDVLLVDEILGVGDERFQRKCSKVFDRFFAARKTVVVVSHSMEMLSSIATHAAVLSNGELVFVGDLQDGIKLYRGSEYKTALHGHELAVPTPPAPKPQAVATNESDTEAISKASLFTANYSAQHRRAHAGWAECGLDVIRFSPIVEEDPGSMTVHQLPGVSPDSERSKCFIKMFPHGFLSDSDVSVWFDVNMIPKREGFRERLEALVREMKLGGRTLALFSHPERNCIYDEAAEYERRGLEEFELARIQVDEYRRQGVAERSGLYATGFMVRLHRDPDLIALEHAWWQELSNGSRWDQISLPVVLMRQAMRPYVIPGSYWENEFFSYRPAPVSIPEVRVSATG